MTADITRASALLGGSAFPPSGGHSEGQSIFELRSQNEPWASMVPAWQGEQHIGQYALDGTFTGHCSCGWIGLNIYRHCLENQPEEAPEPNLDGRWSGRRCPRCQAQTLTNDVNDEWCSYVECDWSNEEAAGV